MVGLTGNGGRMVGLTGNGGISVGLTGNGGRMGCWMELLLWPHSFLIFW